MDTLNICPVTGEMFEKFEEVNKYDMIVEKEGMIFECTSQDVFLDSLVKLVELDENGRLLQNEDGDYPRVRFSCLGRRALYDEEDTVRLEWDFPGEECLGVDFTTQDWEECPWCNEEYLYVSDL